jgi:hypothetical protein
MEGQLYLYILANCSLHSLSLGLLHLLPEAFLDRHSTFQASPASWILHYIFSFILAASFSGSALREYNPSTDSLAPRLSFEI